MPRDSSPQAPVGRAQRGEAERSHQLASYDVVVLGSGIAGSSTALALAGAGFSVLVVERGSHPRFAIGESIVPTTTLGFDHLARRYRVPELANVCSYPELKRIGCAGWPKQHFWFAHHRDGEPLQRADQLMFESLALPRGPDVHMLRSDCDAYLVSLFDKYGIDYLDRCETQDFDAREAGVVLHLVGEKVGERVVRAKLAVDCTGHRSMLAERFGLRDDKPQLETDTRAIFGHFRDVARIEDVLAGPDSAFRYDRDGGTQHHAFAGGWIWVIRFDNEVTSVGVVLDRSVYPLDERVSANEEFAAIVGRFPTVRAQLGAMKPVRPLVRTDRLQFSSHSILGKGFALSPHAAAFVDPLFSSGILLSVAFTIRFVAIAQRLLRRPDYTLDLAERELRPVEDAFLRELRQVDRVVDGMTRSLRRYSQMKQFFRVWLVSSYLQYTTWAGGRIDRADGCGLVYGAGVESWRDTVERMHAVVSASAAGDDPTRELKRIMDALPPEQGADFPIDSTEPCVLRANNRPYVSRWARYLSSTSPEWRREIRSRRLWAYGWDTFCRTFRLAIRYFASRALRSDFARGVDLVRGLRLGKRA